MSREIRYRAWLCYEKKYVYVLAIHFAEIGEPTTIDYIEDSKIKTAIVGQFELEQDTGLKDKNGKKIFEGDIVKYLSYRKDYIGQVVFDFVDDSEGYYVEKHYGWGIRRDDYNSSLGDYADDNMKCELVEVIGNIHKNGELLGGKNE